MFIESYKPGFAKVIVVPNFFRALVVYIEPKLVVPSVNPEIH